MYLLLIVLTLIVTLSCGGGKKGHIRKPINVCLYNIPNSPINLTSNDSSAYLTFYNEKGELFLVDPATSPTPILKDRGINIEPLGPKVLLHGYYNSAEGKITDFGYRYVIYSKGQSIYMIDLKKSSSNNPVRVSSENSAKAICDDMIMPDYSNPSKSLYLYYSSQDNTCWNGDERLKLVILNMDTSVAPIDLRDSGEIIPLGVYRNSSNLEIKRIIIMEKKENGLYDLKSCTPNFDLCESIRPADFSSTQGISKASLIANYIHENTFYSAIVIEGTLYLYDGSSMISTSSTCQFESSNLKVDQDSEAIYIASGKKIIKFRYEDKTCYLLKEEQTTINQLRVGKNRVIYRIYNTIKSIDKYTGNSEQVLAQSSSTVWMEGTEEDLVFYNVFGKGIYKAGVVSENGSYKREYNDAYWGGIIFKTEISIYKRERQGLVLVSLNDCPQETVSLGKLDKIYRSLLVKDSTGGYIIGKAFLNSVTGDIVMFNTQNPSSIIKITDTLEVNEYLPR